MHDVMSLSQYLPLPITTFFVVVVSRKIAIASVNSRNLYLDDALQILRVGHILGTITIKIIFIAALGTVSRSVGSYSCCLRARLVRSVRDIHSCSCESPTLSGAENLHK